MDRSRAVSSTSNTGKDDASGHPKVRIRAAKACKRCSRRKMKCDAMQCGLPCSRCRLENQTDCALVDSRRGTYDREVARRRHQNQASQSHLRLQSTAEVIQVNGSSVRENTRRDTPPFNMPCPLPPLPDCPEMSSTHINTLGTAPGNSSERSGTETMNTPKARSLDSTFEAFLTQRDKTSTGPNGLFLLGEPSPLTYALTGLSLETNPRLHDPGPHICDSTTLQAIQQGVHPAHLDAVDIAYLNAKRVFTSPTQETLDALLSAFLQRFHPLYSIVNKTEFEKAYKERKLPWLLLHGACFIGATFCDISVIHRSGFESRLPARRHFYEKAKLLFDVGYETNKLILLKSAIMLSFWGPQAKGFWNPCSWIGFGVTVAVSLGLHRSAACSNVSSGEKGLLRRLWWTLAGRDAYCSVLLGRPFRINLSQCDSEMLGQDDFDCGDENAAFYQIQVARLSLIIRDITHKRFGPGHYHISPENVRTRLETWLAELSASSHRWSPRTPPFLCSGALELLYNYSLLLLLMETPLGAQRTDADQDSLDADERQQVIELAARTLASQAATIMTETTLCALPHEIFPGFFLAGIILYYQKLQDQAAEAQLAQATFDHCRIVLNEARESWDLARWAMIIFDFLCANCRAQQNPDMDRMSQSNLPPIAGYAQGQEMPQGELRLDPAWETILNGDFAAVWDNFSYLLDT